MGFKTSLELFHGSGFFETLVTHIGFFLWLLSFIEMVFQSSMPFASVAKPPTSVRIPS